MGWYKWFEDTDIDEGSDGLADLLSLPFKLIFSLCFMIMFIIAALLYFPWRWIMSKINRTSN